MFEKILIPKNRIGILRGIKNEIEKETQTKIDIDEDVSINGEAINLLTAMNIVKAIGRGFPFEDAMELLDEDVTLCIISLPHNRKALIRVKSRIIGAKGKAKRNIERLTNTKLSIYGKTVSIIGEYENAEKARVAVEKLITGSSHKNVYMFLVGK
ncbi:MAG: KH domain-containing protein [Candidatus Aenigmatarchaeota archaeon]